MGFEVPVLGFGMEDLDVPLHRVCIRSELLSGDVTVVVRPAFPVLGVAFLMGNDLAGGKVLVTPDVTPVSVSQSPDELVHKFPTVFAACAVTRSMYKKGEEEELDLSDSFLCDSEDAPQLAGGTEVGVAPKLENLTLSQQQLAGSQKVDLSLTPLFETIVAPHSSGYYVHRVLPKRRRSDAQVHAAVCLSRG